MTTLSMLLMAVSIASLFAESSIYFREQFEDGGGSDYGKFVLTGGKFYGDVDKDKGLQTSQDARFYSASSRFESVNNKDQSLVIQFTVKHEQNIDSGGGYLKLFPADLNQEEMHGESTNNIMFDICGPGTKKSMVTVVFIYELHHLLSDDEYTHMYTLVVNPDNTYEVEINNKKDPDAEKPDDWDERTLMILKTRNQRYDWDVAETIPDPDAKKLDDWNDEMDGEWEPPMVTDPDYKGEWKPKQIDNPASKGKWVNPEIDNPDYTADLEICQHGGDWICGTIFDNFLNEPKLAEVGNETWGATKDPEKMMTDSQEEERKKRDGEEINKKEGEEDEEIDSKHKDEMNF
uniref:Calreticulin n=1 Tax=Oncorhynchus mykiss TaxID=8022 RepID=A0A8K9WQY9_ONCMY